MTRKEEQKQEFQNRLKRIASGGPNTSGQIYCGIVETKDLAKNKSQTSVQSMSFMMLIGAFILGALAMTAGRVSAFHFLPGDALSLSQKFGELGGFIAMHMGDLVIAAFLAIIFKYLFHLRGNWRGTALVVGVVSMMLAEAPLMARAPDAFALMFSQDFVETKLYGDALATVVAPETESLQETPVTVIN